MLCGYPEREKIDATFPRHRRSKKTTFRSNCSAPSSNSPNVSPLDPPRDVINAIKNLSQETFPSVIKNSNCHSVIDGDCVYRNVLRLVLQRLPSHIICSSLSVSPHFLYHYYQAQQAQQQQQEKNDNITLNVIEKNLWCFRMFVRIP